MIGQPAHNYTIGPYQLVDIVLAPCFVSRREGLGNSQGYMTRTADPLSHMLLEAVHTSLVYLLEMIY